MDPLTADVDDNIYIYSDSKIRKYVTKIMKKWNKNMKTKKKSIHQRKIQSK